MKGSVPFTLTAFCRSSRARSFLAFALAASSGLSAVTSRPSDSQVQVPGSPKTRPGRLFRIPLDDPELFTANPRWLEFLRNDPLALRQATARLLLESVRLDFYSRIAARYVTVPVLLQLAEHDRIIDNARTRSFVKRFRGETQIIEYAGAHHTLEFEENPEVFLTDLRKWLEGQLVRA